MQSQDTFLNSQVRSATIADLPTIVRLDQEIFGAYGADEEPAIIRARLEVFPAGCVVLEENVSATILGYLTTEKWATQRDPVLDENPHETHDADGQVLNITTLAIDPTYQSQGLGKLLLDQAIEIARQEDCHQIVLETAHAQRFYLRHGFTILSERRQRDISLTVMALEL